MTSRIGVVLLALLLVSGTAVATHIATTSLQTERVATGTGEVATLNGTVEGYNSYMEWDDNTDVVDVVVANDAAVNKTFDVGVAMKAGQDTVAHGNDTVFVQHGDEETVSVSLNTTVYRSEINNIEVLAREA